MLNAYLTSTQLLLQNPAPTAALYSPANLTSFINTARGQLAGESESIRVVTTQPAESYRIVDAGPDAKTSRLEVKDAAAFWKGDRYLVVMIPD